MPSNQDLDLTVGVLGKHVPHTSKTITWADGHKTVLPAIFKDPKKPNVNLCDAVDIPLIKFMARFPQAKMSKSDHILAMPNESLLQPGHSIAISDVLAHNKCVVFSGLPCPSAGKRMTVEYLDATFSISPNRPVAIHDVRRRCADHVNPAISGSIRSFVNAIDDPNKIQCVLDMPLAHISLPDGLRGIDHGLVHGWNETTHSVPITSKVHPENFTTKGWALLHHAGFLTYPHHDAEGTLTWVKMEIGLKFWVIFRLKSGACDRIHLQDLVVKLANFTKHKTWLMSHCDAEVITLRPGDLLIMPPGTVHGVYTPVASFAVGGHLYNYSCMHLTELARYIDAEVADCTTNQALEHALETLRRMVIALPILSTNITLYNRALLSLCIMAKKGRQYRAIGSSTQSVEDTETLQPSRDISDIICEFLGVIGRTRAGDILYKGNQFHPGPVVDRAKLDQVLRATLTL